MTQAQTRKRKDVKAKSAKTNMRKTTLSAGKRRPRAAPDKSGERYRALFENSRDAVMTLAPPSWNFTDANPAALELFGVGTVAEFTACAPWEYSPRKQPDGQLSADKALEMIETAMRDGSNFFEWTHKKLHGNDFLATVLLSRVCVGTDTFLIATVRDITELKQAEDALRGSEERLRRQQLRTEQILSHIGDVIVIMDADGIVRYKSPNIRKIFGWLPEDKIGKPALAVIHPADHKAVWETLAPITGIPGASVTTQCRYQRKDGRYTWIEITTINLLDDPDIRGFLGNYRDIDKRKAAEDALQESEERYRRLIISVTDYIYSVLVENGKVTETIHGAGCVRVTGYTPGELEADSFLWVNMIHADDRDTIRVQAAQILSTGESTTLEHRIIRKDGAVRWVRNTQVPFFDENGTLVSYDGLITDITEHKRIEEEKLLILGRIAQLQKMETIGKLAGGVAHDFNNVLGGITGFADLLCDRLAHNPELAGFARKILACAERGSGVVDQLLAFSRKSGMQHEKFDVKEAVGHVAGILRNTIDKRIEITVEHCALPAVVNGDRSLIENAILNIGINARDAMPNGGVIGIATAILVPEKEFFARNGHCSGGKYVCISVRDTGTGMGSEIMRRLFEPFFTTKESGKGTGLGLSGAYGCMRNHGGCIEVESEPGCGSVFHVYLPLCEEPAVRDENAALQPRPLYSGNVLLVDDEETMLNVMAEMLSDMGFSVACCGNGKKALEYFRARHKDLAAVVLDIVMPGMSGADCFMEMKKIDASVAVVVSSGFTMGKETEELIAGGAAFLAKPFTRRALAEAVDRAIRKKQAAA